MAAVGQVVAGRYRILCPLADGGMARVWLAVDETLGRQVAIKKSAPPAGLTAYERALLRAWALREARAVAVVDHPNVIRTLAVVPDTDDPWLIMEYVPSRTLQQIIDESGPLPPARVAGIGLAVLDGLNAAGRAGVLHLDVKPANVLIGDDGRVVLIDFGPVVTGAGVDALSGAGLLLASPGYVAPERLADGACTTRADLWSLGATLYHAAEGRPPYPKESAAEILEALAAGPPDPPVRAGPLAPVLYGLLQHDPAARLTAAEAAQRLRRLAADGPERPARSLPGYAVRPALRRRVAVLAVLVAAAVLAAAAVGLPVGDQTGARSAPSLTVPVHPAAPSALPPRFRWWDDPSGFRVAVPGGWRSDRDGRGVLIVNAPRGEPTLRISTWAAPPPNVVAALITEERDVRLPAYRRIRIEALPESSDAVWEYTFQDPGTGPMHGLRRIMSGGGRTYLIEWQTPKAAWTAELPTLAVVLDSFHADR